MVLVIRAGALFAQIVAVLLRAVVAVSDGRPSAANISAPTADSYVLVSTLPEVNFDKMLGMALIPGLPDEAVMITQEALLWRFSLSSAFPPYLFGDLRDRTAVNTAVEEGLLGIAFSPQFQTDGRVYLFYNRKPPPGSPSDLC